MKTIDQFERQTKSMYTTMYTANDQIPVRVKYESVTNHNYEVTLLDFTNEFKVLEVLTVNGNDIIKTISEEQKNIWANTAYDKTAFIF